MTCRHSFVPLLLLDTYPIFQLYCKKEQIVEKGAISFALVPHLPLFLPFISHTVRERPPLEFLLESLRITRAERKTLRQRPLLLQHESRRLRLLSQELRQHLHVLRLVSLSCARAGARGGYNDGRSDALQF